jgi:hypothetical protein
MIFVLNYQGKSFVSRVIEAVTWSTYSHTALCTEDLQTIEAWEGHGGVVSTSPSPWSNHKQYTPISVYAYFDIHPKQQQRIWEYAIKELGKDYDYRSILGFLPLLRHWWKDKEDAWFCSHLVAHASKKGGCPLFSPQTPLYKITPGMIDYSPRLKLLQTVVTPTELSAVTNHWKSVATSFWE